VRRGRRAAAGTRRGLCLLLLGAVLALAGACGGHGYPETWEPTAIWVPWGLKGAAEPPALVEPDHDGDGIPNERDRCPDLPEDFDGFQDDDGCPDGIPEGKRSRV
jgi:hypothetical protein